MMVVCQYNNPRPTPKHYQMDKTSRTNQSHLHYNYYHHTRWLDKQSKEPASTTTCNFDTYHPTPHFTIYQNMYFLTYYNNKEPLLTYNLIFSYTPTTPQIPTFLQQLLTTLLSTCTTYPTTPTPHTNRTYINIPKAWHTTQPPLPLPPTVTSILPLLFPSAQSYYTDGSFTPLDGDGKGNIARAGVFNGPLQVDIVARLPGHPNILKAWVYASWLPHSTPKCSQRIHSYSHITSLAYIFSSTT